MMNGHHHLSSSSSSSSKGEVNGKHDVKTTTTTTTLSKKVLGSMYADKSFGAPFVSAGSCVTSVCFDDRGETCITAGNDEKIQIFSLSSGRHGKTHYSKKYGVDLVRFTHRSSAIIHASTKLDHAIRHHSLHDNKYLRYFQGHQSRVSALQMSPIDESFISAAVNESVRLWDLRAATTQACLVINGHPLAAYDPTGQVFALAFNERTEVLLYDARKWTKMPFRTFVLVDALSKEEVITSISFSPTCAMILVGTSGASHFVLDAFDGHLLYRLRGRQPLNRDEKGLLGVAESEPQQRARIEEAGTSGHECGWTPDAAYVFSGAGTKEIVFWAIPDPQPSTSRQRQDLDPVVSLQTAVGDSLRTVAFNPRGAMMVSAGDHVAFWLPDLDDKESGV